MTKPAYQPGATVQLDEQVSADVVDPHGNLRACKVLEWLEVVGGLAATQHCGHSVVAASVDTLTLPNALPLGSQVTLAAEVAHTSDRSIGVRIHQPGLQLEAQMTFVAVDPQGKALQVPPLGRKLASYVSPLRRRATASTAPPQGFLQRKTPRQKAYHHRAELVRPIHLNTDGMLYGGILMHWLETLAARSAQTFLSRPVRWTGLHGLHFLKPVPPDRLVHIQAAVAHTDTDTLTILVQARSENRDNGEQEETLRAFLTFTPGDGKRVPSLTCDSAQEDALFREVENLRSLRDGVRLKGLSEQFQTSAIV
ncbi:hypothetical protein ABS71_05805 [bacterium SCN 62-11]|nr:acyl-CoA thioesterase [Candidatus Eremiobacteraeota bacterium]ODT74299.1 MAG: hypothetical protein ABS71_05805 [bacterium SCN 62-11]